MLTACIICFIEIYYHYVVALRKMITMLKINVAETLLKNDNDAENELTLHLQIYKFYFLQHVAHDFIRLHCDTIKKI